mmetsp:Transcript_93407/g.166163  ORF Transcript_93407/g.166163 Transcript_93407/m.166163 type:complete len:286 (-) Transcript_93407:1139-1996(-)
MFRCIFAISFFRRALCRFGNSDCDLLGWTSSLLPTLRRTLSSQKPRIAETDCGTVFTVCARGSLLPPACPATWKVRGVGTIDSDGGWFSSETSRVGRAAGTSRATSSGVRRPVLRGLPVPRKMLPSSLEEFVENVREGFDESESSKAPLPLRREGADDTCPRSAVEGEGDTCATPLTFSSLLIDKPLTAFLAALASRIFSSFCSAFNPRRRFVGLLESTSDRMPYSTCWPDVLGPCSVEASGLHLLKFCSVWVGRRSCFGLLLTSPCQLHQLGVLIGGGSCDLFC